ncbi:hypothetical protein EN962_16690, partial [Mesorhizobium sp. M7A.F.Ca.CA.001.09.2.1]
MRSRCGRHCRSSEASFSCSQGEDGGSQIRGSAHVQGNSRSTEAGRSPSSALRAPSPRERGEGLDIA